MNRKQNLKLLKALSEETRYRIIEVLLKGETCACKIPALIGRTQSNTSMHLSKLVELDIVQFRKVGKTSPYSIKDEQIYEIFKVFGYNSKRESTAKGDKIMKIEILETGCTTCVGLEDNIRDALKKTGKRAEISVINEFNEIVERGVMSTPAIIIDGEIKSSGHVLSVEKIMEFLK